MAKENSRNMKRVVSGLMALSIVASQAVGLPANVDGGGLFGSIVASAATYTSGTIDVTSLRVDDIIDARNGTVTINNDSGKDLYVHHGDSAVSVSPNVTFSVPSGYYEVVEANDLDSCFSLTYVDATAPAPTLTGGTVIKFNANGEYAFKLEAAAYIGVARFDSGTYKFKLINDGKSIGIYNPTVDKIVATIVSDLPDNFAGTAYVSHDDETYTITPNVIYSGNFDTSALNVGDVLAPGRKTRPRLPTIIFSIKMAKKLPIIIKSRSDPMDCIEMALMITDFTKMITLSLLRQLI